MKKVVRKSGKVESKSKSGRPRTYRHLVSSIASLNIRMVTHAALVVNQALVLRNWMIGAALVEFEQKGADRARYGTRLLETLAKDLVGKGIKGLGDPRVLRDCRMTYRIYPQIRGSVTRELGLPPATLPIRGPVTRESPPSLTAEEVLRLSWTKIQELVRIEDTWKRAFYENECLKGHWSVRQLQRQVESLLYERTGHSRNKKAVIARARRQELVENPADLLRDPYILEFTGLAERSEYSEEQFESALLDHLQRFMLELGQGFCFEARQYRITEGRKHHRVDLVFYHRILRCHVLFELKVRAFRPADAGQMNFYVNWFKANMGAKGDNPPIGILLCSDKDGAEVEYATAGMDRKLFVTRYLTALPSVEQLKDFLERDRAELKSLTYKED